MKRFKYLSTLVLVIIILLPLKTVLAQKSLPQVPITYPGDTDQTINRRLKWIEGAKKEGTLSWWSTIIPTHAKKLISEFTMIYPFIHVDYWRGSSAEIAAKMEAEYAGGRRSVDIANGGEPYNYPRWRKMGMLDKFTDIIPGIDKIPKHMYSRYNDWAVAGHNAITPQYNTKLVSAAEAPRNWEDLLNPKWKGQIAVTPMVHSWYTLALADGGWGIEKTEAFLTKLGEQKPVYTRGASAAQALLIAGEFKMICEQFFWLYMEAQNKKAPVEWVKIRPVPITGSAHTLQKNASHPNAARLFLEWQFSPQGLVAYEKIIGRGAAYPGSGTRVALALEGLPLVYRTEDVVFKAVEMGIEEKFTKILGITPGAD